MSNPRFGGDNGVFSSLFGTEDPMLSGAGWKVTNLPLRKSRDFAIPKYVLKKRKKKKILLKHVLKILV